MRTFAWLCVIAGLLLAVASFVLTAHAPTVNPYPSLVAGFCLTTLGVIVRARASNRRMSKPRPEEPPAEIRVLPTQLQIGDWLFDETGEWKIIGRPFTTAGGKITHARVRKVSPSRLTDLRTWSAHEKISVKRA